MDAVKAGDAVRLQVMRHRLVGREHEFFYQAMRDVALGAGDGFHQAELVEFDDRLGEIEVDRSAALALAVEDVREITHQLEAGDQRSVTLAEDLVAFEDGVDGSVGHAFGGANHTFTEVVVDDVTAVIDFHDAGLHEPIQVRAEAADVGGEF